MTCFSIPPKLPLFLLLFVTLGTAALAQTPTSPKLEELRAEAEALRQRAADIGGSTGFIGSLNVLHGKIFEREEQDKRLDQAIAAAGGTVAELEAYRETEEARRIHTHADGLDNMHQEVWETVIEGILVESSFLTAAAVGGALTVLADVGTNVTKKIWKESDLAAFRQLIADEKLKMSHLYALKIATEVDRTRTAAKIREVEALRDQYRRTMDEIGAERQRLAAIDAEAAKAKAEEERIAQLRDAIGNASLLRDPDRLGDTIVAVELATGLPVIEWPWHWSAGKTNEAEVYYCKPWRGIESAGVDGTDRYNHSSTLCHSGVHAGMITLDGGFLRVRKFPADPNFRLVPSSRNGVTSGGFGSKSPTFSFVPVLQ